MKGSRLSAQGHGHSSLIFTFYSKCIVWNIPILLINEHSQGLFKLTQMWKWAVGESVFCLWKTKGWDVTILLRGTGNEAAEALTIRQKSYQHLIPIYLWVFQYLFVCVRRIFFFFTKWKATKHKTGKE